MKIEELMKEPLMIDTINRLRYARRQQKKLQEERNFIGARQEKIFDDLRKVELDINSCIRSIQSQLEQAT